MHPAYSGQMSKLINLLLVEHDLAVREPFRRHEVIKCRKGVSFAILAGITHRSSRSFSAYRLVALGLMNLLMTTNLGAGKPLTPVAPAGLTATAISTTAIKLVWQDLSSNESGFKIDRAPSSTGPWTVGIATVNANITAYTDNAVAPSTTFYYRVYAYNSRGNSTYSSVASATTFAAVTACTFTLSSISASYGSSAGNGSFAMTTPGGCNWSSSTAYAWIHTSSSGSGSGTASYSVDANGSTSSRSGTITAGGQVFTVTQAGTASTLTLGDALDNTSVIWTTGGSANWIAQTSVAFSGGDAAQSGTIGNGQTSWIQTIVTGPMNLSFYWKVSSEANFDFLHFYVDGVEQTSISGEVDWQAKTFSVVSGAHTVQWAYTKDAVCCASGSDTAWLDQVQLSTATCSYSISPASASLGSAGGTGSFTMTAGAGCSWTASTTYTWIHTTSTGSGSATVNYSVDANGSTSSRSGTITAGGQVFTVTQAGTTGDTTPPTVVLSVSGSPNVGGTIALNVTALDNVGVAKVEFYRDGTLFSTLSTAPYSASFDTRTLANGSHTFLAKAYDAAGNNSSSSVPVLVDNMAPTASLTAPGSGSTVSGTVALSASASDNAGGTGVAKVEFYCDNLTTPLGTATAAPYSAPCDTTILPNGGHNFYCKAYDLAGNSANSVSVAVTVNNTATPSGQPQWVRDIVASFQIIPAGVAIDRSNNVVVAGAFNNTANFGGGSITSAGALDGFVAKYTAQGGFLWAKSFGNQSDDRAYAVAVDSQNNVIVTGSFEYTVDFGGTLL